ncbi:MAG: sugar phosphate isomerase/epimerase family protein [Candidatus Methylomirabilales bacterium]
MKIAGHTMGTPERSLPEAIDLFARLGLEGIEAICHDEYRSAIRTDVSAAELGELRRHAEGQGLTFAAITPYTTDLNSPDPQVAAAHQGLLLRAIEIAHALGAGCVRTYAGRETGGPGRAERFSRLVEAVRGPAEVAAKAGVHLGFENHFNTLGDSAKRTVEVVQAVNHPAVGIVYDQGNLTMLGAEDYRETVPLQAPYLIHVHVKDLRFKETPPERISGAVEALPADEKATVSLPVGEGILPWRQIVTELKRTGYDGWLSIEYERRWYPEVLPPAEIGMKAGAEAVRRILEDLG